ncbi:MAG: sulfotransferase [Pseudomonadota bacterium]
MIASPNEVLVGCVALAACAIFAAVLLQMDLRRIGRRAISASLNGVTAILDSELSDLQKEKAVRASGGSLLLAASSFAGRVAIAAMAATGLILLADWLAIANANDVAQCLMRLDFVLGVTIAALIAWRFLPSRRYRTQANSSRSSVAAQREADQLIHKLAFASSRLAKFIAAMDGWVAARVLKAHPNMSYIFITSLPRAGTTAFLNALHSVPQLAAHEYRDMPFITAPFLWSKLSGMRRVAGQERAHGDGMMINLDSPEAFDEVLWKLYWPTQYQRKQISLWPGQNTDEKPVTRLVRNFHTISRLRAKPDAATQRAGFVSKNNANIARLQFLRSAFPSAEIIIPLRRPGPHAASLHRQHLNFLARHEADAFAKQYMRDIGHFEFGALHKPIAFPDQAQNPYETCDVNYWLFYWVAAFRAIERTCEGCIFVTQDAVRSDPQSIMLALAQRLALNIEGMRFESHFHQTKDACDEVVFEPALLNDARAIYDRLALLAIAPMPATSD